jgi:hypothetical protein
MTVVLSEQRLQDCKLLAILPWARQPATLICNSTAKSGDRGGTVG